MKGMKNMEIRTVKCKSGNVWRLVNEGWSNSTGWGHRTVVIRGGFSYGPTKVKYLNRTWEMYPFQTCMSGAINRIYDEELYIYIENYKYNNNIDRFKKGQKEQVIEEFNNTTIGQDIAEVKNAISNCEFTISE